MDSSLLNLKYYFDDNTGKYLRCEKIEGCEECSSASVCTKCVDGYKLSGGSCKDADEDTFNKLSIASITLSCIGLAGGIAFVVIFIIKKFFGKT